MQCVKFVLKIKGVSRFETASVLYLHHETDQRRIQREAGSAVYAVYQGGIPVASRRLPQW